MRHDETIKTLSGPDFLEAVADAEAANDNDINADIYRIRAKQWHSDELTIRRLERELEEANRALANVKRRRLDQPKPLARHAITPSGSR